MALKRLNIELTVMIFFFFYEQIDALGICILVGKCMQSIV